MGTESKSFGKRLMERAAAEFKDKELFYASILLVVIFSITAPRFFSLDNISNILRMASIGGVLSLGLGFVMMAGDFDLSFATATGMMCVILMILVDKGISPYLLFALVIVLGMLWELINGLLVVKVRIHAFVATIATWTIAKGIIYWITKGRTFYGFYPEEFTYIGRANIFGFIPVSAVIFGLCAFLAYLLGNRTKYGRYLYAVGSNPEAAKYAGIKVDKMRLIAFALNGLCVGIASIILGSKLTSAPATAGEGFQMTVIASAFLGATVFKPGVVNIGGNILAIFLLMIIENGLVMLNVEFFYKFLVQGLIILSAVAFISLRGRKQGIAGKGPAIM